MSWIAVRRIQQAALMGGLLCLGTRVGLGQGLTVSGSPAAMMVTTATAGFVPDPVTDAVTSYTVKGHAGKAFKITGQLNAPMPAGMTLTITLVAPTGATSDGTVTLDATARELVGNITNNSNQTKSITYVISATPAAGVVVSQSRTVTFTLAAWP